MPIPVLLTAFNRPDKALASLRAIAVQEPLCIYVSTDGPRRNTPTDLTRLEEFWRQIDNSNFGFPIHRRRLSANVGLRQAITQGLDWFFSYEEFGLIIEDDVVLAPSSLDLAIQLRDQAVTRGEVSSISLFSAVPERSLTEPTATFRYSIYSSSQAWGTWACMWRDQRSSFVDWRDWLSMQTLRELGGRQFATHWSRRFDDFARDPIDTWDYLWLANNWGLGRVTAVTNTNYCVNIGFDSSATFSFEAPRWFPRHYSIWDGTFRPPMSSDADRKADRWMSQQQFGASWIKRLKRTADERFPNLRPWYQKRLRGEVPN